MLLLEHFQDVLQSLLLDGLLLCHLLLVKRRGARFPEDERQDRLLGLPGDGLAGVNRTWDVGEEGHGQSLLSRLPRAGGPLQQGLQEGRGAVHKGPAEVGRLLGRPHEADLGPVANDALLHQRRVRFLGHVGVVTMDHQKDRRAETPHVCLPVVAKGPEHLRGHIRRRSEDALHLSADPTGQRCGQPEVAEFDGGALLAPEEKIVRLDVSVHQPLVVHVLDAGQHLREYPAQVSFHQSAHGG
mmetsp:Transcript_59360/g.170551  ORF Transcript_59360/g.170551 Transcript_59360/m.170551 type:complete len:242 (+) Transcript_59360:350-1075(+)